ncbi:11093_t:CDS:2 [Gigaspora margarita]|uniref:11093_t:CDS:1 n=1 Tax=Gigaspora margarita TaxID=4874 RepID=A0ABN7W8R7_GIGMA|nr:11093_t:CDS:2 [Gigaspora margarita]
MAKFLLNLNPILPGEQGSSLKLVISHMKKQWNFTKSDIDKKNAENAVKNLTAGRFYLIEGFSSMSQYDANPKFCLSFRLEFLLLSEFKEQMFTLVKRDLDTVDLPENHEFFIKFIEVHSIDIKQIKTIIFLNIICKLIEANIIKEHQNYTVSFHSRYIETYFKEAILTDNTAI